MAGLRDPFMRPGHGVNEEVSVKSVMRRDMVDFMATSFRPQHKVNECTASASVTSCCHMRSMFYSINS